MLAAIRPDSWNVALLLHAGGAMLLVGGLLTAGVSVAVARSSVALLRVGYLTLVAVALPGWVLMRVGAEWIYDKEGFSGENDPAWLGIGFLVADVGGLVLLVALVLGAIGIRRLRGGRGSGLLTASLAIALLLAVAYLVAVWAMGAKPD